MEQTATTEDSHSTNCVTLGIQNDSTVWVYGAPRPSPAMARDALPAPAAQSPGPEDPQPHCSSLTPALNTPSFSLKPSPLALHCRLW